MWFVEAVQRWSQRLEKEYGTEGLEISNRGLKSNKLMRKWWIVEKHGSSSRKVDCDSSSRQRDMKERKENGWVRNLNCENPLQPELQLQQEQGSCTIAVKR